MYKKLIISMLIPLFILPALIYLLKLFGFLDMGNRLLFGFGMISYCIGHACCAWCMLSRN